jgi:hypothetical protein
MAIAMKALLGDVIDYAGLFPPAKLALEPAIRNYARYRIERESWMLGRFICPAARLAELRPFGQELFRGTPFVFSALGRGADTATGWLAGLRADLKAVTEFLELHGQRVTVDVIETRLPAEVLGSGQRVKLLELLTEVAGLIDKSSRSTPTPFLEVGFGDRWQETMEAAIAGLAEFNRAVVRQGSKARVAGLKIRTGGLEPAAFPSSEQLAFAIVACREHRVAMKATAGLHHPIRRFDPSVQTKMHGFFNLLFAIVLARAQRLDVTCIRDILDDERPEDFSIGADGLGWRERYASEAEIVTARRESFLSFGSCSFDEPRDDLRQLGWLEE